jgi:hypothetical protein
MKSKANVKFVKRFTIGDPLLSLGIRNLGPLSRNMGGAPLICSKFTAEQVERMLQRVNSENRQEIVAIVRDAYYSLDLDDSLSLRD